MDLSGLAPGEREAAAAREAEREAQRPFDLARDAPLRARLLRLGARDHLFLITVHHIAVDGWSLPIVTRELSALYEAFAAGRPSPLPELPIQYADFADWQRLWLQGEVLEEHAAYWKHCETSYLTGMTYDEFFVVHGALSEALRLRLDCRVYWQIR